MIESLSIAVHAFVSRVSMSFSVDETLNYLLMIIIISLLKPYKFFKKIELGFIINIDGEHITAQISGYYYLIGRITWNHKIACWLLTIDKNM